MSPRPERARPRLTALALVVATGAVALAGCAGPRQFPGYEDDEPKREHAAATPTATPPAAATPAASTPATTPIGRLTDPALLGRTRTFGGVTFTPLVAYTGAIHISVRDGFLAAAVPSGEGAELQVAPNGGTPSAAEGASPLPVWAQPHVGSDAAGRTVVTYPRCADAAELGTCDLYVWTAATGKETLLRGTASDHLAETEGVMDEGNALVAREKRPSLPAADFVRSQPPFTTLLYRAVGEKVRVVTRHGGRELDLRGDRIADVLTGQTGLDEACPATEARALTLDGLTVAARTIACGERGRAATDPSLYDGHLRFAVRIAAGGQRDAYDIDLGTGEKQRARIPQPFERVALDRTENGYTTRSAGSGSACTAIPSTGAAGSACLLSRVSGLRWVADGGRWAVAPGDAPVKQ